MRRLRQVVLALAVVVAMVGVAGWAWTASDGQRTVVAAHPDRGSTTSAGRPARPSTTTPPPPSTTTTATTARAPAPTTPARAGLARGTSGPAVEELQRRLADLRLDPGPVDGRFGGGTLYAVQGFQKLAGIEPTGVVGPETRAALAAPPAVAPLVPGAEGDRVEVDLERQLLLLWEGGELRLVTHVSTGSGERYCEGGRCGTAVTPAGGYRFSWRWPGWRQSRLGRLYNPVYFTSSGIAVHGSTSVPTYPASHGCVRIPMHIAEYFPSLVDQGDAVYVVEGPGRPPPSSPVAPTGPPPADPPAAPEPPPLGAVEPPPSVPEPTPTEPPGGTTTTTTTSAPPAPPPPSP